MLEGMWRATWQGSLMVAVIWLIVRYVPGIRPATRANLWWLASLKFLIAPAAIFIPLAVLPLSPADRHWGPAVSVRRSVAKPGQVLGGDAQSRPERAISVIRIEPVPWLLIGVGAIWGLGRWYRDWRKVKSWVRGGRSVADTPTGDMMRALGIQMGLAAPPRLMVTPNVSSPMVVGFFRPIILLPETWAEDIQPVEMPMLLAHELAHVKRRDLMMAVGPELAQIVFFFCPLAWFARQQWAVAREAACDAEAIAVTGASLQAYSNLLLRIVTRDQIGGISTAMGATASYHTLKERFQMIQRPLHRSTRSLKLLATAAAIGCAALVLPWQLKSAATPEEVSQRKTVALSNLRQVGTALMMYIQDYDGCFPPSPTSEKAFAVTFPYIKFKSAFKSVNPAGGRILFNPALSSLPITALSAPAQTPMVFDELPWPDATYLFGFADGHVKTISPADWIQVKRDLKKRYPRPKKNHYRVPGMGG